MFQIAAEMLLASNVGGQYQGDFEDVYGDQYSSKRWLNTHLMDYCNSGLGTKGEVKKCVSVGLSLSGLDKKKYVHQLSKGCFPGVTIRASGGRCDLPGWDRTGW
mmetsp:Transcript_12384/g.29686  ORF Transcript_12384/g.29686 Transcript_12384/m.29686 type:complete len:104 (+) Transcript_12384:149-460(+)